MMRFKRPAQSEGNIDGALTFNKMVKLFTHKCFQRYPEFQIKELLDSSPKKDVTNNSTTTYDKRGRNNSEKGKGCGKGKGEIIAPSNIAPAKAKATKADPKGKANHTNIAPAKAKATKVDPKGKANHTNLILAIAIPNHAATVGSLDTKIGNVGNDNTMKKKRTKLPTPITPSTLPLSKSTRPP
jgi:hypothetical protein